MTTYTDGTITIQVCTKYAHLYNKAGSEIGRADMQDGSYMKHMISAGFKEIPKGYPEPKGYTEQIPSPDCINTGP